MFEVDILGIKLDPDEMKRYGSETEGRFQAKLHRVISSLILPEKAQLGPFRFDKLPEDVTEVIQAYHASSKKNGSEVPPWKIALALYFRTNNIEMVEPEQRDQWIRYYRTYCIHCRGNLYGVRGFLDTATNTFRVRDLYEWDTKPVPFE